MLNKLILLTFMIMSCSSYSQSLFNMIANKHSPQTEKNDPSFCQDFSGNWEGTCSFSDRNELSLKLEIYQKSCSIFKFNGHTIPLRGLITMSDSNKNHSFSSSANYNWIDESKTTIKSIGTSVYNQFSTNEVITSKTESIMKIKDGVLIIQGHEYSDSKLSFLCKLSN